MGMGSAADFCARSATTQLDMAARLLARNARMTESSTKRQKALQSWALSIFRECQPTHDTLRGIRAHNRACRRSLPCNRLLLRPNL